MTPTPKRLYSLELGRGAAALLVLMYHLDRYYFNSEKYYSSSLLNGLFKFGHSGVEYFFVLSGFVMISAHWRDLGQTNKVFEFIKRRVIRIYPLVWISTILMLILYLSTSGTGKAIYRTLVIVADSLFLVGRNPLNAIDFPSWTLWHENIFYLFCAIIIWRPRIGAALLTLWAAMCVAAGFSGRDMETTFYPLDPINALFFCGAGTAVFLKYRRLPAPGVILILGLLSFLTFGVICDVRFIDFRLQHAMFGSAATMIVAGAVELERSGRLRLPRWAATAGTLSYPLYLTHMLVLPIAAKALVASRLIRIAPPLAGMAILVGVACAGAMIVHRWIEEPIARILRARWLSKGPPGRTSPTRLAPQDAE